MATRESDANQIQWIDIFFQSNRTSQTEEKKGVSMRIVTASVIIAALSLGTPAFVQAQAGPSQSEAQPSQSSTVIRSIQVVDVKDLEPAVRTKVDEVVAQTREEDIQSLR